MERAQPSAGPGLRALALAACLVPPALLAWRLGRFPGWELTDESCNLGLLAGWREGAGLPWAFFHGCLYRALDAGALALAGWRLEALWALNLGIYGAFMAALARLGRRLFGPDAAWAALAVAGLAALPAVQLGSLLSPQLQPLTWTLLALAALGIERRWAFFLWGLACGAALLDYEGWALAWPGAMALLLLRPAGRRGLPVALAGCLGAAGLVLWHSWPAVADYLTVRQVYSRPPDAAAALSNGFVHLRQFFLGHGAALPTQGVPGDAAQFPLWALPFLAAAGIHLLRAGRDRGTRLALALAAALPFGAFLLYAPAVPSERVLAAWPALCLLAGERLAAAWRRSRTWALALLMLAVVGGVWELRGFTQGLEAVGPAFYGGGGALLAEARDLATQPQLELFSELDAEPRGDLRMALGRPDQALRQGPAFAVVPWQSAPALQATGRGRWIAYGAGAGLPQRWLYQVPPAELALYRQAHQALRPFWAASQGLSYAAAYRSLVAATAAPIPNPLLRDALWEARFLDARRIGRPEPQEGRQSLALGMLRVDPLLREAADTERSQPGDAEYCYRMALQRDPRRREAWRGLRALLVRRHADKDLVLLDQAFQKLPPQATFEPFWLRE